MNSYESMIVLSADLSENDTVEVNEKILEQIKALGGDIVQTDKWGKRSLCYEINKKKEGHYFINYFSMSPSSVPALERSYKLNDNIIRYNLLRLNEG